MRSNLSADTECMGTNPQTLEATPYRACRFLGDAAMNHIASWFMTILAGILAAVMMMFTPRLFVSSSQAFARAEDENGLRILGDKSRPHFRRRHLYIFYPQYNIYHDVTAGRHYHYVRGTWRSCTKLPFKPPLGPSVALEMDTDKPYLYNNDHKKRYYFGRHREAI